MHHASCLVVRIFPNSWKVCLHVGPGIRGGWIRNGESQQYWAWLYRYQIVGVIRNPPTDPSNSPDCTGIFGDCSGLCGIHVPKMMNRSQERGEGCPCFDENYIYGQAVRGHREVCRERRNARMNRANSVSMTNVGAHEGHWA